MERIAEQEEIAGRQEIIEWLSKSSVNKRKVAKDAEISARHLSAIINGNVHLSKDIHIRLNSVYRYFRENPHEYARRLRATRGRSTNRVPMDMRRLSSIWIDLFNTPPPKGRTKVARALIDYLLRIRLLRDNKDGLILPDYRAVENWKVCLDEGKLVAETASHKNNRII
jgi:hypothetical protein